MVSKLVAAGKAARADKKAADAAAAAKATTGDGKTAAAAAPAGISLRRMLDFARPEAGPLAVSVATLAVTTGISLVFPYAIGERSRLAGRQQACGLHVDCCRMGRAAAAMPSSQAVPCNRRAASASLPACSCPGTTRAHPPLAGEILDVALKPDSSLSLNTLGA